MLFKYFRVYKKKLAEGSAYLVYNGTYNGENLKKNLKFKFWALKVIYMSSYVTHI